jgi:hypothetical protein
MKPDWKGMRQRIENENHRIRERRRKHDEELAEKLRESGRVWAESFGRSVMRMGTSGQPRSRIFAEKMAIPKERRR